MHDGVNFKRKMEHFRPPRCAETRVPDSDRKQSLADGVALPTLYIHEVCREIHNRTAVSSLCVWLKIPVQFNR